MTVFSQSFSLSATASSTVINGPLAGATTGGWQSGNYTAGGITQHYAYLLPYGWAANKTYRLILYLHYNGQVYNWYAGGNDELTPSLDPWFNTSAFRSAYPAIILCPFCDQTQTNNQGSDINFGGATSARQPAETNTISMVAWAQTQWSIDPTRIFCVGSSMGAIACWAYAVRYNTLTGTSSKVFRGFMPFDGNPFEFIGGVNQSNNAYPSGAIPSTIITALTNVPIWSVHGQQDTTMVWGQGVTVGTWDEPLYRAYGGSIPGPGTKAPNSQMYFTEPNVGHGSWDPYLYLPTGKARWDWMFSF